MSLKSAVSFLTKFLFQNTRNDLPTVERPSKSSLWWAALDNESELDITISQQLQQRVDKASQTLEHELPSTQSYTAVP